MAVLRRLGLALLVTALLALPASAFAAGSDSWTPWVASPSGATVRSLDFIGGNLFGASEDDGVFVSPTVVGPWAQQNTGLDAPGAKSVRQVVSNSGNLYAATTAGLFRSAGGTGAWTQIGIGDPPRRLNQGGIQSIVFNSPSDMVVAVSGASPSGIFYSSDSGDHWDRAGGLPQVEAVFHMTTGPAGTPIYAAAEDGIFISLNQGRSWTLSSDGIPPSESTFRVAVDPADPTHLYASTSSSVYRSYDGGVTWAEAAGGSLPAAGAKYAFLLAPTLNAQFGQKHAIVGTAQGVYATVDDGDHWESMSQDTISTAGEMHARTIWSLGLGFSPPSLMAGTQGFGVHSLPLAPATAPGSLVISPSSSLNQGDILTVPTTGFGGTLPLFFTFAWKRCTTSGCTLTTNIPGAVSPTYTVNSNDVGANTRFQVQVCAINLVSPSPVCRTSALTTAGVAAPPGTAPRPNFGSPSMTPTPSASYPWGQVLTVVNGTWRTEASSATITPDSFRYRWRRCDTNGNNCEDIPGATAQSYTTQPEDVGHELEGWASATDGGVSSEFYLAGHTFDLIEKTPVNTELPQVIGDTFTGTVLGSTAGAWDAHNPAFTRRWLRCESDGLGCNPTSPVQTGSTYTLTDADLGKRLAIEVTATVTDPNQNRVTTVVSQPSAVVTPPPPPEQPGGGGNPPPGDGQTPPPGGATATAAISGVSAGGKLTTKKPLVVALTSATAGTLRITVQRLLPGKKVGKKCKAPSRKLRKKRNCTRAVTLAKLTRKLVAGANKISIPRKIGKRTLPVGKYRAILTPVDASGKAGPAKTIKFRVARR